MADEKELEKKFRIVERHMQAYKAQPDLNTVLRLAESIDVLADTCDELVDEEESVSNVN